MLTPLLPVLHLPQQHQADCLAACAAMILDHLHIPFQYVRLKRLLNVQDYGSFFSNLENLRTFGLSVVVDEGNLETLLEVLDRGLPVIVSVQTGFLRSYWQDAVGHAIVVIGTEDGTIYVHDPALPKGSQPIQIDEFLAAWGEKDFLYGVIGLE